MEAMSAPPRCKRGAGPTRQCPSLLSPSCLVLRWTRRLADATSVSGGARQRAGRERREAVSRRGAVLEGGGALGSSSWGGARRRAGRGRREAVSWPGLEGGGAPGSSDGAGVRRRAGRGRREAVSWLGLEGGSVSAQPLVRIATRLALPPVLRLRRERIALPLLLAPPLPRTPAAGAGARACAGLGGEAWS